MIYCSGESWRGGTSTSSSYHATPPCWVCLHTRCPVLLPLLTTTAQPRNSPPPPPTLVCHSPSTSIATTISPSCHSASDIIHHRRTSPPWAHTPCSVECPLLPSSTMADEEMMSMPNDGQTNRGVEDQYSPVPEMEARKENI